MNRLQGLFYPKNIAVVGASENNHYSASIVQNLLAFGFPVEKIYPVNPKYKTIFGRPCYSRVSEVPEDLDLAVLVIRRDSILPILEESFAKKLKAVLMVSTGFGESDEQGRKLQAKIAEIVRRNSVALCGPNTLGFFSSQGGLALWSAPLPNHLRGGPIGAVFHSSGLLNLFLNMAADRCLGVRYAIACGNEADLDMVDYFAELLDDPEVKVIVTLIESIRRPEEFRNLLDLAREKEKPVVALRVGRSAKGSRAVVSHTGNLATSGAAWQALFRQKGVISVDNMDQMIETAVALVDNPCHHLANPSSGIGIVTISGGDCSFLSDICERAELELPDPTLQTYQALSPYFGKEKFNGNPLDIEDLHQLDESKFYGCLKAFIAEEHFDLVCCRLSLPKVPNERLKRLYTCSAAVAREGGKGIVFLSRASEHLDRSWFEFFSQLRVPFLLEYEKGLRAVRDLLWLATLPVPSSSRNVGTGPSRRADLTQLKSLILREKKEGLNHQESRQVLSAYGIPLAKEALTQSASEAVAAAKTIGFPVAMKVISPDLPHKTEIGALLMNLPGEREVEEGFDLLNQRIQQAAPKAYNEGILVQKMISGVAEIIVGTITDRQLGPVALFGLGGIYTEILKDFSLRLPPLSSYDAWEMIREVRGKEVLRGVRGQPRADIQSVIDILLKISQLASDLRDELEAVELNPLIVLPEGQGAVVVDTLLRRRS